MKTKSAAIESMKVPKSTLTVKSMLCHFLDKVQTNRPTAQLANDLMSGEIM
jgi:hypothetical protein